MLNPQLTQPAQGLVYQVIGGLHRLMGVLKIVHVLRVDKIPGVGKFATPMRRDIEHHLTIGHHGEVKNEVDHGAADVEPLLLEGGV